ncbi:MAG: GntR family transcriptional regulator [Treponema sp.]|nr:GntR family transcriptional regulator [Treponema sp.]
MEKNDDSSVQSAVYNALRNNIMSLKLKPGTVMSTQEMAIKLEVSRTPVREAFIRLQRDGLVNIYPQKETIVSRIDYSKVEQERFVRESLECANLDIFIDSSSRKDFVNLELNLEQQRATISSGNYNTLIQLDNAFHAYMFKATGQHLSWNVIEGNSNHYARIRLMTVWNKDIMQEIILQHQKILSAIEERNAEYAKIYMKAHVHRLENLLQQTVKDFPDYFVPESIPAEIRFAARLAEKNDI